MAKGKGRFTFRAVVAASIMNDEFEKDLASSDGKSRENHIDCISNVLLQDIDEYQDNDERKYQDLESNQEDSELTGAHPNPRFARI